MSDSRNNTSALLSLLLFSRHNYQEVIPLLQSKSTLQAGLDNALLLSSKYGDLQVLALAIEAGADRNVLGEFSRSAIHQSLLRGHQECFEFLLTKNVDADLGNNFEHSPIQIAAMNGNNSAISALEKLGGNLNQPNSEGWRPLHLAVQNGHLDTVNLLLSLGAQIDGVGKNDMTPIAVAIDESKYRIATKLIESNANLNLPNVFGETPIFHFKFFSYQPLPTSRHFVQSHPEPRPSIEKKLLSFMIENGADVSIKANDGREAIHLYAFYGLIGGIRILLKHGADIDVLNKWDESPIFFACRAQQSKTIEFLERRGANTNQKNRFGKLCADYIGR